MTVDSWRLTVDGEDVTVAVVRRVFFWYLPLAVALSAAGVFATGFYSFVRGDTGTPVDWLPSRPVQAVAARDVVAPVILGDSVARGVGDESGLGIGGRLHEELRRRRVPVRQAVNLAVSGARTADLLTLLESQNVKTVIAQGNAIIVSIGGNDLWGGSDWRNAPPADPEAAMNAVLDRIERVVAVVREVNPSARVFVVGLYNPFNSPPFGATVSALVNRWNAKLTQRFASDSNVTVVQTADLFSHRDRLALDRFHPGAEAYTLIARRIADSL